MFESLLYLIDQFGRPVTINFSGKEKYKSKLGGICTIVFVGFLVWALYNASRDLFARENPKSLKSETYSQDPREMTLTPDSFPFAIGIQTPSAMGLVPYIDDEIYTVTFLYIKRVKTVTPDGTVGEIADFYTLNKEPCTPAHFGMNAHNFEGIAIDQIFCIALDQPEIKEVKLQGVYASQVYDSLIATVGPCVNDTSSPITCKSPDVIKTYLTGGWFNILYVNMVIDPKNFSRPDARYREVYSTMMSPANYKEATVSLGHVDVTTDSGWIVPELNTEDYIMLNKINEIVQFEPDTLRGLLYSAVFEAHSMETHHMRSYKTIQNVLAEVGGLANIAIVLLFSITLPYLKLQFNLSLINELFDIHLALPKPKRANKKRRSSKKNGAVALSIENDKEDSDSEKPKNTNEMQQNKTTEAKGSVVKSNYTSEVLITKSPLFSRVPSGGSKQNKNQKNQDWKEINTGQEALNSNYLPLDMHSPKEERNIKESLQINSPEYSGTVRVKGYYEGKNKLVEEGGITVKSRQINESLFAKGSRFAQLTSQENPNADWEALKGESENPSLCSSFAPQDMTSPINQHDESHTPFDIKQTMEKRPFKSNYPLSKSSSFNENDDIKSPQEQLDKNQNSPGVERSNVELMKIRNDLQRSRYSSILSKQQLVKVSQKDINKRDKYIDPLVSSLEEFYDPENYKPDREKNDSNSDPVEIEMEKIDCDMNPAKDIEAKQKPPNEPNKNIPVNPKTPHAEKSLRIEISFSEYLLSFIYQTAALKQKMDILAQGRKNIETRLDLVSILKKLREIDKLKAMLLDIDQAILFNNLPKPEIRPKELVKLATNDTSFTQQVLKKPTFIDKGETASIVFDSHRKLQVKTDKNQIDQRLIAIFTDKTS